METETFKIVKIFRKSGRRITLRKGLSRDHAKAVVISYPSSNTSMVVFYSEN